MGEGHNPFNLFTGRPFAVNVKEINGFQNYDACQFFDLALEQSGMRIVVNNAQRQPQVFVVTTATIAKEQGKDAVFKYLKENVPDTDKYEYHPWTIEETEFLNECIRIYYNPQATIQAMSAAQNPGMPQVATQTKAAQTAQAPVQLQQMQVQVAPAPAPAPAAPQFGLDGLGVAQTSSVSNLLIFQM